MLSDIVLPRSDVRSIVWYTQSGPKKKARKLKCLVYSKERHKMVPKSCTAFKLDIQCVRHEVQA